MQESAVLTRAAAPDRVPTLVIPCFNEADRLQGPAFEHFLSKNPSWRLLFVNDGSTDDTTTVLRALEARLPRQISVLLLEKNGGKAEAVRRGILAAIESGTDYVGFWDADLATPLAEAPAMLSALETSEPTHAVIASRVKLLGRNIQRRAARHYLGRVFATMAAVAIQLPVYDSQCGAKIFRVNDATRRTFGEPFFSRWIFDVEMLARLTGPGHVDANARVVSVIEFPVDTWTDVPGSKVKVSDFVKSIAELGYIWWHYRQR